MTDFSDLPFRIYPLYEFPENGHSDKSSLLWFFLKNVNFGLKMKILKFLGIHPTYSKCKRCWNWIIWWFNMLFMVWPPLQVLWWSILFFPRKLHLSISHGFRRKLVSSIKCSIYTDYFCNKPVIFVHPIINLMYILEFWLDIKTETKRRNWPF